MRTAPSTSARPRVDRGPAAARQAAALLARGLMFIGPPRDAAVAGRARRAARHRDEQRRAGGDRADGVCLRRCPREARAAERRARAAPARALGAKMLAAAAGWTGRSTRRHRRGVLERARGARRRGSARRRSGAQVAVTAVSVLVLADADEALGRLGGLCGATPPAAARCTRSAASTSGAAGRGWRGELAEAEASLLAGNRACWPQGGSEVGAARGRALARVRSSVASSTAARRPRGRGQPGAGVRRRRSWPAAKPSCSSRRARRAGARGRRRAQRALLETSQSGLAAVAVAPALASSVGVATRAICWRTGARAGGAGARPGALARALRVLGHPRRDDGHDQLREAVAAAEGSPSRLEQAKALVALGARCAAPPADRGPRALRGGSSSPTRCGAAPLAEQARPSSTRRRPAAPHGAQRARVADPDERRVADSPPRA